MCTETTSWIKHAGGVGQLMQLRGAHRHREGFDYVMFLAFRGIIVCIVCLDIMAKCWLT